MGSLRGRRERNEGHKPDAVTVSGKIHTNMEGGGRGHSQARHTI